MANQLFTELKLRGVTLKNRIVLSPMMTYSAKNGYPNEFHFAHYAKYAVGGVGLIFVESTKVDPRGCTTPNDLGLWKDDFIAPLAKLAAMIKSYGATAGIQIGNSGRKARHSIPWEGREPLGPEQKGVDHGEDWELIGPSAIPPSSKYSVPRAMTKEDIRAQIDAWCQAARRADQAGFDVLDLHGAHGYLMHQFLSASSNQRTDEYGGSFENRMRFPLELVEAVRKVWPAHKPLFYRISAVDEFDWTIESSVRFCKELKRLGVDVVDCSSGGIAGDTVGREANKLEFGYQVGYARDIRHGSDIATMAVGLIIHADQAEQIVKDGSADLVAIGREFLHNPNWVLDAAEKLGEKNPYAMVAPNYGYWLEKRAGSGFRGNTSTCATSIEAVK